MNRFLSLLLATLLLIGPTAPAWTFEPPPEPAVASGTCTLANTTLVVTAGLASWGCAGLDLSGRLGHKITVTDSTGKQVIGFAKAVVVAPVSIVSTKGGTTYNWAADSGINVADAAGYTYTISKVNYNPVVAGATIAATAVHVQTVSPALVFLDAIDLSPYASTATASHYLCLYDSSNRALCAYAGAVGAGEGLSATELITNGAGWTGGPPPTGWTPVRCTLAQVGGGEAGNGVELTRSSGTTQYFSQSPAVTVGALYKGTGYVQSGTSGNEAMQISINQNGGAAWGTTNGTSGAGWAQLAAYATAQTTVGQMILLKNTGTAGTMLWDTVSLKQVTAGPATGLDLRSTGKLGGTQVPVFTTTGFSGNAVTRWAVYYVGG